jgi:hypothetical protein
VGKSLYGGFEEADHLWGDTLRWGKSIMASLAQVTELEVPAAPQGRSSKIFIEQKLKPKTN